MAGNPRIAVTIVTVTTEQGDFVLLGAQDPRWRLDNDGKFEGVSAINASGEFARLPLQPGFIGGEINDAIGILAEKPEKAALRELREEAGNAIAQEARRAEIAHIYTAEPKSDKEQPTTAYFHAHLNMRLEKLKAAMKAGDDNVVLMLVRPEQIAHMAGRGYVLNGPPVFVAWREYEPIKTSRREVASAKKREIIEKYDAAGQKEPLVGIDAQCLQQAPPMFAPPGCSRGLRLSDYEIQGKKGEHVSNGAIFEQLVKPRLAEHAQRPRQSAAHAL